MAVIHLNVWSLCFFLCAVADSSPKMNDGETGTLNNIVKKDQEHKDSKNDENAKVLYFTGNFPPEVVKAVQETIAKHKPASLLQIDKLIPENNKIVFTIQLRKPMSGLEVIGQLSEAVAKHANLPRDTIKVTKYEPYSGIVKMFFVSTIKRENNTEVVKLRPVSEVYENLVIKKRLQNAGHGIKILDIHYSNEHAYPYPSGKKIIVRSIFSDKNWKTWQLAVLISASLFTMFFIFVVIQVIISTQRIIKNKIRPLEEPRHVIIQPVLRPIVAGVGVIQPQPQPQPQTQPQCENRDHHIAAVDTDSEHTPSPSRSPMRRGRGLLERRGSNASLTLDLNRSQENIHCGTPPKECSAEEFLQSASKRMTRRQLRSSLKDVKALHSEFWEIPMNHPEKVEIAGSGTKNRYKTILPNESTRVHLNERSEDPLSSYINANYIRGYRGEEKAYIATQGPLPHTVNDFWLMVWKEKSPLIVMITKLKEKLKVKCEPYIPDYQDHYGDIEVTVLRVIPREGYTVRELLLRRGSETQTVLHFWYTTWPDHKTPATAKQLLGMALEAENVRIGDSSQKRPIIVHCSAGIGRTGCFIAASVGIQQLLEENSVDILGTVSSLRLDRGGMVQTAEQYEFVHQALSIFELTLPGSGE